MIPHGPDYECFTAATNAELKPAKIATGTMVNKNKGEFLLFKLHLFLLFFHFPQVFYVRNIVGFGCHKMGE